MQASIVSYTMLNHNVLELVLHIPKELPYKPGQRILIDYKDVDQVLKRAYSIVEYKTDDQWCLITLAIKIIEWSKSIWYLKKAKMGDTLEVIGVFGNFILQETDNPKVFIGTGTWLAPLIAMAEATPIVNKILYFSVSYISDLFYVDRIQKIRNLKSHIHVSRELSENYIFGRINLSWEEFPENTEFYLCGNPKIVSSFAENLQTRWYQNIYTEKY